MIAHVEMLPIPRREPELIAAEAARRYRGDTHKVATTSIGDFETGLGQTLISSRYRKADEFEVMRDIVHALPDNLQRQVSSFYCDSKASGTYTLLLRAADAALVDRVLALVASELMARAGGFNGLAIDAPDCGVYVEAEAARGAFPEDGGEQPDLTNLSGDE